MSAKFRVLALASFVLCATDASAGKIPQRVQSKAPARDAVPPPTMLEVQRFSGDFTDWGDSLTIHSPQKLTFRWATKNPNATSGMWQVNDRLFRPSDSSPHLAKVLTFGSLPETLAGGNPTHFTIDFAQIIKELPATAPKNYYVRAIPLSNTGQPLGQSFPVVTITYGKAPPGTTFQFDTLKVVSVAPSGGTLQGPPENAQALNATNSIEIVYSYEVNTEDAAEVRQWLLLEGGGVAQNNFWFSSSVKKGKGTVKTRATIKCAPKGQKPTAIKGIDYKLTRSGTVLAEGTKSIPGVTFTCPYAPAPAGYLKIKSLSPAAGTIYGPKEGQSVTAANSVLISYEYEYTSSAAADIRQWALRDNGTVETLNFWTFVPVTKGKHTAQTRLTVRCEALAQGPRTIKGIRYGIYPKSGGNPLYEQVAPVDFTFRCSKSVRIPRVGDTPAPDNK